MAAGLLRKLKDYMITQDVKITRNIYERSRSGLPLDQSEWVILLLIERNNREREHVTSMPIQGRGRVDTAAVFVFPGS